MPTAYATRTADVAASSLNLRLSLRAATAVLCAQVSADPLRHWLICSRPGEVGSWLPASCLLIIDHKFADCLRLCAGNLTSSAVLAPGYKSQLELISVHQVGARLTD